MTDELLFALLKFKLIFFFKSLNSKLLGNNTETFQFFIYFSFTNVILTVIKFYFVLILTLYFLEQMTDNELYFIL